MIGTPAPNFGTPSPQVGLYPQLQVVTTSHEPPSKKVQGDNLVLYLGILYYGTPIMENQMEKKMENDMETGVI